MKVAADATAADHGDRVAGLHLSGIHGRTPTGDDAATQQAGLVERDLLLDLDAAGLVHHGVMRERAQRPDAECKVAAVGRVVPYPSAAAAQASTM